MVWSCLLYGPGMLRMRIWTTLLLLTSGCTWISQADIDARQGEVDDDGDGYLSAEDCNDDEATINPGAEEVWYDGIDADCAEDNDYDADADGYSPDAYTTEAALPGGDCDDEDSEINPSSVEILSDSRDLDCDGNGDSMFALQLSGYSGWVDPMTPRFDENVSAVYLSVTAEEVAVGSLTHYDSAIALAFDPLTPLAGPTATFAWLKHIVDPSSYGLTPGHDFLVTNSHIFGITGLQFSTHRTMRLGGYALAGTALDGDLFNTSTPVDPFTDLTLAQDASGDLFAFGCDDTSGLAQYFSTSLASAIDSTIDNPVVVEDFYAEACELHLYDDPDGTLITSQSAGLVTDLFDMSEEDDLTLTEDTLNASYTPFAIEVPDGSSVPLTVVADPGGISVLEGTTLHFTRSMSSSPIAIQTAYDGSNMIIAYANDSGEAALLVGDPTAGSMSLYDITIDFSATGVAAWVSTGTLFVAVTGTNELAIGAAEL